MSIFERKLIAILLFAIGLSACGSDSGSDTGLVSGLDSRPANPRCIAPNLILEGSLGLESPFGNEAQLGNITKILQNPAHPNTWFVLLKGGRIKRFETTDPLVVDIWLDLSALVESAGEGGLLSMAFHPQYPSVPEIFVYFSAASDAVRLTKLMRVVVDDFDNPAAVTQEVILSVRQDNIIHHGGDIAFGPDGYLYLSLGDGDNWEEAPAAPTRLQGSILRIDVDGTGPGYNIPPDNPFVRNPLSDELNPQCSAEFTNPNLCPEVFAWGLRNPYRMNIDGQGRIWVTDVGKDSWEEINLIEPGRHYGWPCREGAHPGPFDGSNGLSYACPLAQEEMTDPVHEYFHDEGFAAVVGGFVYAGTAIASLQGKYIFGDFITGKLGALAPDANSNLLAEDVVDLPIRLTSIAQGNDGEIYIADWDNNSINRLVSFDGQQRDQVALNLADTGCADEDNPTKQSEGMIPYEINAPFWSDGAAKSRYFAIPDGTQIEVNEADDWAFPIGTVLRKDFRLKDKLIETRLFMRHPPNGIWAGYTYIWDSSQSSAARVIGGKTVNVDGHSWIYPSETQCMVCHTRAAGFSLGPETAQLNLEFRYPSTGRSANQITTLDHIGMIAGAPQPDPAALPKLADPLDTSATLDERARAWLHTNCSQCHRPGGVTQASMDLRYTTALADTNTCDIEPGRGDLGIAGARLIKPGDASGSIILARMSRRDAAAMPPLGSALVDEYAVNLVGNWIDSLNSCR